MNACVENCDGAVGNSGAPRAAHARQAQYRGAQDCAARRATRQLHRELLAASQESQRLTDQLPEAEKGLLIATDDKLRCMSTIRAAASHARKRGSAGTEHRAGSMDGAQCASRRTGAAARSGAPLVACTK